MHMADALLSPAVGLTFGGFGAAAIAYCASRVSADPEYEQKVPLMGVFGAFVFSAQMINFSLPGTGSSGHLTGGLLLALLLGPHAAILVMSSILVIQSLLFADGGLLALGCNIFNLAIWPAAAGFVSYRLLVSGRPGKIRRLAGCVAAGLVCVEFGALSVVVQTLLSGRSSLAPQYFLLLMGAIHLPIAVAEGLLTGAVLELTDSLQLNPPGFSTRPRAAALLILAVFISGIGVWFASARPDGLEWALQAAGFAAQAQHDGALQQFTGRLQQFTAVFPDYELVSGSVAPFLAGSVNYSVSAAGMIGVFATLLTLRLFGGVLARRRRSTGRGDR